MLRKLLYDIVFDWCIYNDWLVSTIKTGTLYTVYTHHRHKRKDHGRGSGRGRQTLDRRTEKESQGHAGGSHQLGRHGEGENLSHFRLQTCSF